MLAETSVSTDLTRLSDAEFSATVNADVRGPKGGLDPSTAAALRDPALAERWWNALVVMKRNVEAQLTSYRAERTQHFAEFKEHGFVRLVERQNDGPPLVRRLSWDDYRTETEEWRRGAVRFRNALEDRLLEAKALRSQHQRTLFWTLAEEREGLRAAIARHRDAVCDDPDNSETADDLLWSRLDSL